VDGEGDSVIPSSHSSPAPPAPADEAPAQNWPGRLGVWGRAHRFYNGVEAVQVTSVATNTASQHLNQKGEAGDKTYRIIANDNYITEVNGKTVRSFEELADAVAKSPRKCEVKVFNGRTGKHAYYIATLY
jgi:hypothetical protein